MRLLEHLGKQRDAVLALASAHGAENLRVFGSAARGEDGPGSDIDFLVVMNRGRTLLDLARLEIGLENLLRVPVDVMTEDGLREPVRSEALSEAIRV